MTTRSSDPWHEGRSDPDERDQSRWGRLWGRLATTSSIFDWALPLYTAFGIRVRIHLIFILMIAVELIRAVAGGYLVDAATWLGATFLLVLLHEYGHCFAARMVRGDADEILMWPLGGLASCRVPHNWRAELITVIGGPAVHIILLPILMLGVIACGGGRAALLFNPFDLGAALVGLDQWWQRAVWWLYFQNAVLFVFNMAVPMYPMDAGRFWQCILWPRLGFRRALTIMVNIGLVVAVALGLWGLFGEPRMVLLAVMGGVICWGERQRLRFIEQAGEIPDEYADDESPFAASLAWKEAGDRPTRAQRRAAAAQARADEKARHAAAAAQREQAEVDRILTKIAQQGLASLSRAERRALERETERKRSAG